MNHLKNILNAFLLLSFIVIAACNKSELFKEEIWDWTGGPANTKATILTQPTLLGNDIYLPAGTKCIYSDKSHHEVVFILPKGYAFLLRNRETRESEISIEGGGYSCTCTGGGGCTTFYNEDLGYGCLQHHCSGSCVGKRTKSESADVIEGVLVLDNDRIDKRLVSEKASLSDLGKTSFFDLKEVQQELKRTYDIVYKYLPKPNFKDLDFGKEINFVYAKTYLYGFEIGLILPNDSGLYKWMPDLKVTSLMEASKSCKCSGASGTSCKLKRAGLLGYEAYYCNGCTTCEMN
ncbi:MAG: hypothetical protein RLZ47_189 [Bacteroidota bacterium]|jgi:hypothetical protein